MAQTIETLSALQETQVQSLGWEDLCPLSSEQEGGTKLGRRPQRPDLLSGSGSSGWSFHMLKGSCPCRGREEPVPWRNRIWVDARDTLGGGGRGVEQSGPGSCESLDLLTYVLEAFLQPWERELSPGPVGRVSSGPAPLGTRGGWDPAGRDSCGNWTWPFAHGVPRRKSSPEGSGIPTH